MMSISGGLVRLVDNGRPMNRSILTGSVVAPKELTVAPHSQTSSSSEFPFRFKPI